MKCQDPTREEMLAFLQTQACGDDIEFDAEEAIYWFANDWHGGQDSNLYSALSTSPFSPGPIANKPEDFAADLYMALEAEYCSEAL